MRWKRHELASCLLLGWQRNTGDCVLLHDVTRPVHSHQKEIDFKVRKNAFPAVRPTEVALHLQCNLMLKVSGLRVKSECGATVSLGLAAEGDVWLPGWCISQPPVEQRHSTQSPLSKSLLSTAPRRSGCCLTQSAPSGGGKTVRKHSATLQTP